MLRVFATAISLALVLSPSASADVIFNNFGPGGSFNPTSGYAVEGPTSQNPQFIGYQFIAGVTQPVTSYALAISAASANGGTVNLQLFPDNGNNFPLLSTTLDTATITGIPAGSAGTVYSAGSTLSPLLTAGTPYWLVATMPGSDSSGWLWTNPNNTSLVGFSGDPNAGLASGVTDFGNNSSAFLVNGVTGVPEPSSVVLGTLGVGMMLGAGGFRRWKRSRENQAGVAV